MTTYYLQEGLRPIPPKTERDTHGNEPGVYLDDKLPKDNELINTLKADNWIQARKQLIPLQIIALYSRDNRE